MTKLIIDAGLSNTQKHSWNSGDRDNCINKALSNDAVTYNWKNKTIVTTEEVVFNTVPTDAYDYHYSYLGYLQNAYARHEGIVVAPHTMWYSLVCEIAQHVVSNSKQYARLFTKTPDTKINIAVPCNNEHEPLRINDIYEALVGYVPINTELFLPKFTTSTDMSSAATLASFLETCSPYYNYFMLACGYPSIMIDGNNEDWELYKDRASSLASEFSKMDSDDGISQHINNNVLPIIDKIMEKDVEFMSGIFSQKPCGSGSQQLVDGWFTKMFMKIPSQPEVSNFATHITKVPYTTLPSGTKWNLCFMLGHSRKDEDGFMVPDFDMIQIMKLGEPKVRDMNLP